MTLLAALAGGARSATAACPGDCNGDNRVSVAELTFGVRISLGEVALFECDSLDVTPDGELRIEELIMAVNAALLGCPSTPTATAAAPTPTGAAPTASVTATDTPATNATSTRTGTHTPTTSATPTVPMVSGLWREDPLIVGASTCPTPITEEFAADLASRPPCDQTVEALSDTTVAVEDCTSTRVEGTLDRDGTIRIAYPTTSDTTPDGCIVELTVSAVVVAAMSPTTATYTFDVSISGPGTCPEVDCTMDATGTWTRL